MKRQTMAAALGSVLLLCAPCALQAQERGEERERAEEQERAEAEERAEAQERAEARVERRVARARLAGSGAYLGVSLRDVAGEDVSRLGLSGEYGAIIERVSDESPADEAGLEEGDVITAWNGERIESVAMLTRRVRETPPGRTVSLGVLRDGSQRPVEVELGERSGAVRGLAYAIGPEMRERMEELRERLRASRGQMRLDAEDMRELREKMRLSEEEMQQMRERMEAARERLRECIVEVESTDEGDGERRIVIVRGGRGRLGVRLQALTSQLGEYFEVAGGEGALVTSVEEDSPAAAGGIQAGDVIVEMNSSAVGSPGDAMRAMRRAEAGPAQVTVIRKGERRTLTVTLEEAAADDCEDLLVAPAGEPHSFLWPSLPHAPAALPPLPHGPYPVPVLPRAPLPPGEVEAAPGPPAAPLPPARTV